MEISALFVLIIEYLDLFQKVYELMLRDERFYPSFRQNALYVRMLAELDMLKDPSFRGSDDGDGGKIAHIVHLSVYICIFLYIFCLPKEILSNTIKMF